jgi:hypothetical protein
VVPHDEIHHQAGNAETFRPWNHPASLRSAPLLT